MPRQAPLPPQSRRMPSSLQNSQASTPSTSGSFSNGNGSRSLLSPPGHSTNAGAYITSESASHLPTENPFMSHSELRVPGASNSRHIPQIPPPPSYPSPRNQDPDLLSPFRSPSIGSRRSSITDSRRTSVAWDNNDRDYDDASRIQTGEVGNAFGPYAYEHDMTSRRSSYSVAPADSYPSTQSISEKYAITPSTNLLWSTKDVEPDDYMHNPDPVKDKQEDRAWCAGPLSKRGAANVGGLILITLGLLTCFIGYPIITELKRVVEGTTTVCDESQGCVIGASEDQPDLSNTIRTNLIDPDTPSKYYTKKGKNGNTLNLVFSDEFNKDGRTFYPGDDQFFQANDLHYWATQDLEWYDPDQVTTQDGTLQLKLSAYRNHDLNYRSGMVTSWNKLCVKGGLIEASISLPGSGDKQGLWPAFWTMGNLGRPGYGATTDGMWPYSYNSCDVGITPNQSSPDGISGLPGMRLPSCTCSGEDHPNQGVGRSAPEIDAIEAAVDGDHMLGHASQSLQVAPFDIFYTPNFEYMEIYNTSISQINTYRGGSFQQSVSGLTNLNNRWYEHGEQEFQSYGFEYVPGADGWVQFHVGDEPSWAVEAPAIGPNGNIGQRIIPEEPLQLIANLGLSNSFTYIDWLALDEQGFPFVMKIDYIRVYQDEESVTCDPPGYETTQYIADHEAAYTNPNYTNWAAAGYDWPQNTYVTLPLFSIAMCLLTL
ncbi:beta-glucan synthesis-associated protein [Saitoella coloradoensis]